MSWWRRRRFRMRSALELRHVLLPAGSRLTAAGVSPRLEGVAFFVQRQELL